MTDKLTRRLDRLDGIYCLWMLFLALLYYIPFIMSIVDLVYDVSCVFGVAVIGYRLFTKQYRLDIYTILLGLFLLFYAVTAAINGGRLDEAKVWLYLAFAFFLFFSNTCQMQAVLLPRVMYLVTGFALITGIASLILFLTGTTVILTSDLTTDLGIVGIHPNGALYGLIGNSNRMSWIAIFGICSSVYLMHRHSRKPVRILLGLHILLQFVLVVCSNSRGGILGLCVFAVVFTFLRGKLHWSDWFKGAGAAILVLAVLLGAYGGVKAAENVYYSSVIVPKLEQEQDTEHASSSDHIKKQTNRSSSSMKGTFSARLDAYQAGMAMFAAHPILGVGKEGVAEIILDYLPESSMMIVYETTGNLHSTYITLLASSGLAGFLVLAVFMLLHARLAFRFRRYLAFDEHLLIALLLSILCINLFETEILYTRTFSCFLFWFYFGVLSNELRSRQQAPDQTLAGKEIPL